MNTALLAPNGQPTNLTPQQYHLVRTPAFKAWFGDWELLYTKKGFANAIRSSKNKIYNILLESADSGPFDGGCVIMAYAIQKALGTGEIVVLETIDGIAQHAALKTGNLLFDFDGPENETAFIKKFNKNELAKTISVRKFNENDLEEAPRNEIASDKIAELIKLDNNTSKVIDENGEPLVLLHGSNSKHNVFDIPQKAGSMGRGIYLTTDSTMADFYGKYIYQLFVNIKNPKYVNTREEDTQMLGGSLIYLRNKNKETYDGVCNEYNIWLAISSNQIKLADGTNTTFSEKNNDIRYANGGAIKNTVMLKNNSLEEKLKEKINVMLDLCNSSETPVICGMLQTSADRFQLVEVLAHKVVMEKLDIEQAIIALDNEYNPNTLN